MFPPAAGNHFPPSRKCSAAPSSAPQGLGGDQLCQHRAEPTGPGSTPAWHGQQRDNAAREGTGVAMAALPSCSCTWHLGTHSDSHAPPPAHPHPAHPLPKPLWSCARQRRDPNPSHAPRTSNTRTGMRVLWTGHSPCQAEATKPYKKPQTSAWEDPAPISGHTRVGEGLAGVSINGVHDPGHPQHHSREVSLKTPHPQVPVTTSKSAPALGRVPRAVGWGCSFLAPSQE